MILDDLQTADTASSQEQVQKLLDTIKKDIMNLGGKQRLSILQTATPIQPDDLVDHIMRDLSWKTTTFKALEKFPDDMAKGCDSLWAQYFNIFDSESLAGDTSHAKSLEMY